MKPIPFYIMAILLMFISKEARSQIDTLMTPTDSTGIPSDTVYFAGYKAIYYDIHIEGYIWEHEWKIYLRNTEIVKSIRYAPAISLFNYFYSDVSGKKPCYFQDINGDGMGEIMFIVPSGGNDGRASTFIYSLDTVAIETGVFDGLNTSLSDPVFVNLDNALYPEISFYDRNYDCWPDGCAGAPAPVLVWKWDNNQYRLANFKLGEQILKQIYNLDSKSIAELLDKSRQDTVKIGNFNPSNEDGYPTLLIDVMLELIYTNHSSDANRMLEYSWAENDTTKKVFEKVFWDEVKSGYYWQELQKSKW